ncbi:small nuclear ribonucleoprotein Sm D3 [Heptranchias perlo]|uniref:small nuclear ribonucleoprotein Sm D3 n=1 Tax=Heptranchias perlo TaxID=212740 RepID=UPI0035595DE1
MSIGVPIKVLHEAEGHVVTCETNTGEVYRGKLIEAEDNMNCQKKKREQVSSCSRERTLDRKMISEASEAKSEACWSFTSEFLPDIDPHQLQQETILHAFLESGRFPLPLSPSEHLLRMKNLLMLAFMASHKCTGESKRGFTVLQPLSSLFSSSMFPGSTVSRSASMSLCPHSDRPVGDSRPGGGSGQRRTPL